MPDISLLLPNIRVIESPYVPEFNYETVKRTWKERLLTRPFKPFTKYKIVRTTRCVIKCEYGIICNPATALIIRTEGV